MLREVIYVQKILSKNQVILRYLLPVVISVIGIISVPLHIIFSPNPYVSVTKFTIQSNIIVTIIFIIALLKKNSKSYLLDLLKNSALVYMIIIMATYHFILARGGEYSGTRVITNFTLHYLIPILVFINWIFFEEKRWYSYNTIFFTLAFPLLYGVISLIRGMIDGFYPYFFLNPNIPFPDGVGNHINVLLVIVGFTLIYFLLRFLVVFSNRVILNLHKKVNKEISG